MHADATKRPSAAILHQRLEGLLESLGPMQLTAARSSRHLDSPLASGPRFSAQEVGPCAFACRAGGGAGPQSLRRPCCQPHPPRPACSMFTAWAAILAQRPALACSWTPSWTTALCARCTGNKAGTAAQGILRSFKGPWGPQSAPKPPQQQQAAADAKGGPQAAAALQAGAGLQQKAGKKGKAAQLCGCFG